MLRREAFDFAPERLVASRKVSYESVQPLETLILILDPSRLVSPIEDLDQRVHDAPSSTSFALRTSECSAISRTVLCSSHSCFVFATDHPSAESSWSFLVSDVHLVQKETGKLLGNIDVELRDKVV